MDPLSLTAGILTIAGAARSLASGLDKLSSVYSAPALLNALKDEISCLCAVLDQLQHGMTLLGNLQSSTLGEVNRPNQDPRQLLQSILLTAQQKILQLRPTVENCLKDGDPCEEPKVRKRLWLRRQSHIEQLQRELATIRADLIMALTALNL